MAGGGSWFAPEISGSFGKAISIQHSAFSHETVRMRELEHIWVEKQTQTDT